MADFIPDDECGAAGGIGCGANAPMVERKPPLPFETKWMAPEGWTRRWMAVEGGGMTRDVRVSLCAKCSAKEGERG